ncbi:MAG: sigma-70 family RNA polymerase sigma factor [Planctomycetota bacterium]
MNKPPDSISVWLEDLKNGDEAAGFKIWNRYVGKLIALARSKLKHTAKRESDEEDLVITAFNAFFEGVQHKRFQQLDNRDDLWQILIMLTERKAIDHIRRQNTLKRGQGKIRGESIFEYIMDNNEIADKGISIVQDPTPTAEFAAQFSDELRYCFEKLDNSELQQIVLLKMEGFTNTEIAERIERSLSSVERKLRLIRQLWN